MKKKLARFFFFELTCERVCVCARVCVRVCMSQLNHLSGLKRVYVKLSFHTVNALVSVRNELKVK